MRLGAAQPGDIVMTWHQTSERDASPIYARVLRVGKVFWTVQDEFGNMRRVLPEAFTRKLSEREWRPDSLALCMAPKVPQ